MWARNGDRFAYMSVAKNPDGVAPCRAFWAQCCEARFTIWGRSDSRPLSGCLSVTIPMTLDEMVYEACALLVEASRLHCGFRCAEATEAAMEATVIMSQWMELQERRLRQIAAWLAAVREV